MANIHMSAIHHIPVDMEKIFLQNQKSISVGNMGVNARGDEIGEGGKVIKSREQVIKEWHEANPALNDKAIVNIKTNKIADAKLKEEVKQPQEAPAPAFVAPKSRKQKLKVDETIFENIATTEPEGE